jgi:hypothetical protein
MGKYLVRYTAYIEVEANSEDEVIGLAIEEWENNPDGHWDILGVEED